jgi:acylphosphatase
MATRLVIKGKVQGVFFRAWSTAQARALNLKGWVRNRTDGSVEMLIDGAATNVAQMITLCHQGPPTAKVERVETHSTSEEAPDGFEKRPTV